MVKNEVKMRKDKEQLKKMVKDLKQSYEKLFSVNLDRDEAIEQVEKCLEEKRQSYLKTFFTDCYPDELHQVLVMMKDERRAPGRPKKRPSR